MKFLIAISTLLISSTCFAVDADPAKYLTKEELFTFRDDAIYLTVIGILISIILTLIGIIYSRKKATQVTEEKTRSISDLLKDKYYKANEKQQNIIHKTESISDDTARLIRLSEKMENNISDISKNPEKSKKSLKKDIRQAQKLLKEAHNKLQTRDGELAALQKVTNEVNILSVKELGLLTGKFSTLEAEVQESNKYIIDTHRIMSGIECIDKEAETRRIIHKELAEYVKQSNIHPI